MEKFHIVYKPSEDHSGMPSGLTIEAFNEYEAINEFRMLHPDGFFILMYRVDDKTGGLKTY